MTEQQPDDFESIIKNAGSFATEIDRHETLTPRPSSVERLNLYERGHFLSDRDKRLITLETYFYERVTDLSRSMVLDRDNIRFGGAQKDHLQDELLTLLAYYEALFMDEEDMYTADGKLSVLNMYLDEVVKNNSELSTARVYFIVAETLRSLHNQIWVTEAEPLEGRVERNRLISDQMRDATLLPVVVSLLGPVTEDDMEEYLENSDLGTLLQRTGLERLQKALKIKDQVEAADIEMQAYPDGTWTGTFQKRFSPDRVGRWKNSLSTAVETSGEKRGDWIDASFEATKIVDRVNRHFKIKEFKDKVDVSTNLKDNRVIIGFSAEESFLYLRLTLRDEGVVQINFPFYEEDAEALEFASASLRTSASFWRGLTEAITSHLSH